MKKLLFVIILGVVSISCDSKNTTANSFDNEIDVKHEIQILYHEIYKTSSSVHIKKWNIDKDSLPINYVEETVDSIGRVAELKFYINNTLKYGRVCHQRIWVKYEYPNENTIIVYFLDAEGKEDAGIECEMASKYTYTLSDDQKTILSTKSEYSFDKELYTNNGWNEEDLDKALEELYSNQNNHMLISHLDMSFSKMANTFPVSDSFDLGSLMYNDAEKDEILRMLNN